eukprot:gene3820-6330_t
MAGTHYFVIVSSCDHPVFERFVLPKTRDTQQKDPGRDLLQFIAHSALDAIDELMWKSKEMYLKTVDNFNEWLVSGYVTPSKARFILVHDGRNDDIIKSFFQDVHDLYGKALANPLHNPHQTIRSKRFDERMDILLRRLHV